MSQAARGGLITTVESPALPPGRKFLLGIGINVYLNNSHKPLRNAINDLDAVVGLLVDKYDFERENLFLLKDEQATREEIINRLDRFTDPDVLGENDSLLIYFAGHGYLDKNNRGYWVPVDSRAYNTASYIPNGLVKEKLSDMKCRHVLLISDSCFSGSLLEENRAIPAANRLADELERRKSRWIITSGRPDETVSDGGGDNSPFAEAMLYELKINHNAKLLADVLAQKVRSSTASNSRQIPQTGKLFEAGDRDGQFVFTLRNAEPTAWELAVSQNTTSAFESFLKQYPDSVHVAEARERIAAVTDAEEALQIANTLPNKYKAYVLPIIAESFIKLGDTVQAKTILEQALLITANFRDSQKVEILPIIAEVFVVLGDTIQAKNCLEQALKIVEGMPNYNKIKYQPAIAKGFISLGDTSQAKFILDQALSAIVDNEYVYAVALTAIAECFTKLDDEVGLEKTLSAALSMSDELLATLVLIIIAEDFTKLRYFGRSNNRLKQALSKSVSAKFDKLDKGVFMLAIAEGFTNLGSGEGLQQAYEAVDNANLTPYHESRVLFAIAKGSVGANYFFEPPQYILAKAKAWSNSHDLSNCDIIRVLSANAECHTKWGEFGEARKVMQYAFDVFKPDKSHNNAGALFFMADGFAKLDDTDQAETILKEAAIAISNYEESDRGYIMEAIAEGFANIGWQQARDFIIELDTNIDKANCLYRALIVLGTRNDLKRREELLGIDRYDKDFKNLLLVERR